jgi:hypothetical protein
MPEYCRQYGPTTVGSNASILSAVVPQDAVQIVGSVPHSCAVLWCAGLCCAAVELIGAAKAGRAFVRGVNAIPPIFPPNLKKFVTERVRKNVLIMGVNTCLSVLPTISCPF